jgi:hypothetical protein
MPQTSPAAHGVSKLPADPVVRHNVAQLNAYRAAQRLPPLMYDAHLEAFAYAGSAQLARDHVPHAHFRDHVQSAHFGTRMAENQGDPTGVYPMDADPMRNAMQQVDVMLKMMMDEGPGGGHHDTIVNPALRRVGVGLVTVAGRLYLTNDFSD